MVKFSEGKSYKVIAYVISCFSNEEQMRIIKHVAKESHKYNCKVVFFTTITDFFYNDLIDAGEKKIFELIEPAQYDAIVLMSETFKANEEQLEMIKRAHMAKVPVFTIDKSFDGCINLIFDYKSTFREIVKHMVEFHGFKTINYIGGIPNNRFSDERLGIYKEILEANHIPFDEKRCYYGYFWEDPTVVAMKQMFQDWPQLPEAIICANDAMALAAIKFLRDAGYRVPEDIAVSGFDAIDIERFSQPRLTTGVYNLEEMVHCLFEMIEQGGWEKHLKEPVYIHNRVQIGESCGCDGLRPESMVDELRQLKQEAQLLISCQNEVNQMVANYGNVEDLGEVVIAVANYIRLIRFKELWICFDKKLTDFLKISDNGKWLDYSKMDESTSCALHYAIYDDKGHFKNVEYVSRQELIPNREVFLSENDYCMINVMHLDAHKVGYTVVKIDVDEFNFMAYDPFLTSIRHLIELQQFQRKIMQIYEGDQLTGLLNRNGFYKKVNELFDKKEYLQFSIINIDMDGLKQVNDTYGHAEGDEALQILGEILKKSVTDEIVARIGGDEFLIAFAGRDNEARAEKLKALIIQGLDAYNQNSTKPYVIQASMGAFTANMYAHSLDYFLKNADEMMYITKSQHKKEMGEKKS